MKKRVSSVICAGFVFFAAVALPAVSPKAWAEEESGSRNLAGKKVAVLLGEGFQDEEAFLPIGFLSNRGAEVTVIGVSEGYVKAYNSDIYARVEKSVDDVNSQDYDAIVIPGGKSPAYLRQYASITDFVKNGAGEGKVIAAICHGPELLIEADLVEGKSVAAYPDLADELYSAGAEYADVPMMREGKVITSRNPDDLPHFVNAIEKALLEKE